MSPPEPNRLGQPDHRAAHRGSQQCSTGNLDAWPSPERLGLLLGVSLPSTLVACSTTSHQARPRRTSCSRCAATYGAPLPRRASGLFFCLMWQRKAAIAHGVFARALQGAAAADATQYGYAFRRGAWDRGHALRAISKPPAALPPASERCASRDDATGRESAMRGRVETTVPEFGVPWYDCVQLLSVCL